MRRADKASGTSPSNKTESTFFSPEVKKRR